MAISTYAELQTAVASWAHRSTDNITDFIDLAESRINAALESRMAEFESSLTATTDSRYIALPTGYYNNIGLWLTTYGNRVEIVYVQPDSLPISTDSSGQPYYYTIDGSNIAFEIPCSSAFTYVFRYKKGYDIASTSTNDILTRYPNVYLYGSLREASMFANDDQNSMKWNAAYDQAMSECMLAEFKNKTMATLAVDNALLSGGRPGSRNIYAGGN